jgi:hypothetical protein
VLRLRLRKALVERPSDLPLMLRGIEVLSRTLARRYHLDKQQGRAAAEAIRGVLDEVQVWREAEAVKGAARG